MDTNVTTNEGKTGNSPGLKKKIILTAVGAAILLGGGSAAGYTMFDWFKSPKQIYLEAEAKSLKTAVESWGENYQDAMAEVKPYLDSTVHSKSELGVKIDWGDGYIDEDVQRISNILKDSKIVIENERDPKAKKEYSQISLAMGGSKLIGFDVLAEEDRLLFGMPELYSKYAMLDLKKEEELKDKFGIENLPKRIVQPEEFLDALKIPKEELTPILLNYGKLYYDELQDEQVKLVSDVAFDEDSKIKGREITVTFTDKQFKNFLEKTSEKLEKDQGLIDLFYTRYGKITKLLQENGYEDIKELDKSDFKDDWQAAMEDFRSGLEDVEFSKDLQMILLVDSSDQIIDRKVFIYPENDDKFTFRSAKWTSDQTTQQLIQLKNRSDSGMNDGELKFTYTQTPKDKGKEGNVDFSFSEPDNEWKFSTDYSTVKDGNKKSGEFDYSFSNNSYGTKEKLAGNFEYNTTENEKDKKTEAEYKFTLKGDKSEDPEVPKSLSFTVKQEIQKGAESKIPVLKEEQMINVASITEEDQEKIQTELRDSLEKYLKDKKDVLEKAGVPVEDLLSAFQPQPDPYAYGYDGGYAVDPGYGTDFPMDMPMDQGTGEEYYEGVDWEYAQTAYSQSCAACHAADLSGAVGPALYNVGEKYYPEEIADIIINGRGGMPPGMASDEDAYVLGQWLVEQSGN
ncbi:c-type cytochrome [Ammoniphilus resinae]|uniref:Cytochrome c domain-containing protein n=1 Tax=Ammoniphilus resinae TaxID=861532 RepID=A0ABS4GPL2_9BACL|nr:cytochrome c [Ammoniphilus resinae]MBP1932204.1 hypothetical protein [Ammoniphilus resinae]